jgi:hypothetical protein
MYTWLIVTGLLVETLLICLLSKSYVISYDLFFLVWQLPTLVLGENLFKMIIKCDGCYIKLKILFFIFTLIKRKKKKIVKEREYIL